MTDSKLLSVSVGAFELASVGEVEAPLRVDSFPAFELVAAPSGHSLQTTNASDVSVRPPAARVLEVKTSCERSPRGKAALASTPPSVSSSQELVLLGPHRYAKAQRVDVAVGRPCLGRVVVSFGVATSLYLLRLDSGRLASVPGSAIITRPTRQGAQMCPE